MAKSTQHLAFDLGASSGRAILGTFDGERMAMETLHRFETPLLSVGERLSWDLEALWEEIYTGLAHALDAAPSLRSVSVDSWAVDYVPLDEAGAPLRNPYCYRDPRTAGVMESALARVSAAELYAITGIQFLPFNTLYQVLADREQEPALVKRTATRLLIADYFNYRLSGRAALDLSNASTTQLMDVRRRTWSEELMQRFGLATGRWPEIVPCATRLGQLLERPGVEVVAGCSHDTACAVAAVPAEVGTRWAYLSSGTWSLLGVERAEPILSDAACRASFTNEAGLDGTIRFLKNITGLWVLQECERAWAEAGETTDYDTLLAEAHAAPANGAVVDLEEPGFAQRGAMPEKLRASCRAAHGLPIPETRGAMVRLILKSLAATYRDRLRQLEALTGEPVEVLHVVGGGSQNALLCQWTADACGCRVVAGPAEATALGNLLVQARALGDLPAERSLRAVARAGSALAVYEPRFTP